MVKWVIDSFEKGLSIKDLIGQYYGSERASGHKVTKNQAQEIVEQSILNYTLERQKTLGSH